MQETTDAENEEMDWRRPRVLVETVENWRKSNSRASSSGTARRQSRSLERTSSWISLREDGVWPEQSPEEAGVAGSVKVDGKPCDLGKRITRAGSRSLFINQGTQVVEERLFGGESVVGSSYAIQDVGDESTDLQLGFGPSSSKGMRIVGDQERKDQARKDVSDTFDSKEDPVMVPDSQRCGEDRQNGSGEAEDSLGRRTRLGKQIEMDESDDEDSRPETLLCLGTHPRFVSTTGNSGLGSSSRSPGPSEDVPGIMPGIESTPSRGKRKRDLDRSESAAAVGIALENAGSDFDSPGQSGPRIFQERSTRRLFTGGLNSSSLRDRRRTAQLEREPLFSLLQAPSRRRRPVLRRHASGVSLSIRPDSQPIVLDPEQVTGAEAELVGEESHQPLTLSLESPPSTTNPAHESPAGFHSQQIIDLISPEPDQLHMNGVIDLVSPERSPVPGGLTSNLRTREEIAARRAHVRRDRMRWTRNISDRLRASTARQRRAANGAGSSQDVPDVVELPANEQNESESSRRRAEPSQYGGAYFMGSGLRSPWDFDDVRVLEELPVHNHPTAGSYRRRHRRFFPGADMPSGGSPTIRGHHHGHTGDFWADTGISDEELLCYTDTVLALGDSDDEDERTRQLAEDERIARQLQAAFASEAVGGDVPDDETLARILQAEEDSLARDFTHARGGDPFGLSGHVQRYFGDLQSLRRDSPPRFLRHARPRFDTSAYSSSSSRFNFGPGPRNGRFFQLHRGQQDTDPELPGGRVQFPSHMTVESRLEVLAALESAIQEQVSVGLQLAQVDRDFNENDYEMLLALDTDLDRNKGASLEKIALLPVTTLQPTDVCEDTCSICLEMQVSGEVVRRLPCIHVFHMKCIDKWLQRQAVCPVCKAHI